ncbi:hypothetical protein ACP4OV_028041 [Aristida adscensionis]
MAGSDASPPPAASAQTSPSHARKEELLPVGEKISELNESQSELLGRLRGLKEVSLLGALNVLKLEKPYIDTANLQMHRDLKSWRSNLDSQVQKYKVEISDIKSALNNDIEQLRSDFQELRTTLKKQQEDVSLSLKNLGLEDDTETDGKKGSGEENTNEGLSANLGNLKLEDASENHDDGDAKEVKAEPADEDGSVVDNANEEASSSDE